MKPAISTIFGSLLKSYRTKKGLTQQQLADFTGLDRSYISDLENGKSTPSLDVFFTLTHELKVKPDEFVKEIERQIMG